MKGLFTFVVDIASVQVIRLDKRGEILGSLDWIRTCTRRIVYGERSAWTAGQWVVPTCSTKSRDHQSNTVVMIIIQYALAVILSQSAKGLRPLRDTGVSDDP